MKLVVDTNILLDVVLDRKPFSEKADLLFKLGYIRELELWIGSSQISDLIYVITQGGKPAFTHEAQSILSKLRKVIHIYATNEEDCDSIISYDWPDLEDALVFRTALGVKADFIITRDHQGFDKSLIRTMDCDQFFDYLKEEEQIAYAEILI